MSLKPLVLLFAILLAALLGNPRPVLAAEVEVLEQDMAFVPDHVTIKQGDRILFRNIDDMTHQVIVVKGPGTDGALAKQAPGETAVMVLSQAGRVEIGCDRHSEMSLVVTVE